MFRPFLERDQQRTLQQVETAAKRAHTIFILMAALFFVALFTSEWVLGDRPTPFLLLLFAATLWLVRAYDLRREYWRRLDLEEMRQAD
ncbi:MAG: hypothetical protein ACPGQL_05865 [Thermoplasmatota archaeon]